MTLVQITYGVRKHPDHDGWLPVVTEHVEGSKPHTSAPWGRPLDEDHALFLAKDTAEDWASRYSGDFTVVVSEAAPERGPRRNPLTLVEELDALAAHAALLLAEEDEYVDVQREARPILNRHLGHHLGPSADWVNPTWRLGGDLYLFEDDYGDYEVVSRTPNEDPDEPDVIEEVERLADLDALRRYFRMRRNPRRKAPPPPPSHTFALEASAVQQGLFAPSSYEAKQKEKPRPVVDERQVDLFGMPIVPPPPKKNPDDEKKAVVHKLSNGIVARRILRGHAYARNGNAHNATPRYSYWLYDTEGRLVGSVSTLKAARDLAAMFESDNE